MTAPRGHARERAHRGHCAALAPRSCTSRRYSLVQLFNGVAAAGLPARWCGASTMGSRDVQPLCALNCRSRASIASRLARSMASSASSCAMRQAIPATASASPASLKHGVAGYDASERGAPRRCERAGWFSWPAAASAPTADIGSALAADAARALRPRDIASEGAREPTATEPTEARAPRREGGDNTWCISQLPRFRARRSTAALGSIITPSGVVCTRLGPSCSRSPCARLAAMNVSFATRFFQHSLLHTSCEFTIALGRPAAMPRRFRPPDRNLPPWRPPPTHTKPSPLPPPPLAGARARARARAWRPFGAGPPAGNF